MCQFDTDISSKRIIVRNFLLCTAIAIGAEYAYFIDHTRPYEVYANRFFRMDKAYQHYLDPDDTASASLRTHAKPMKRVKRLHRFDV